MKIRVSLQSNGRFDGVARTIADDDPPKWLVIGLQHFSQGFGVVMSDCQAFDDKIGRMQWAIHLLTTWLPMWAHAGYGEKCPDDIALALYVLPRIKEELDRVA